MSNDHGFSRACPTGNHMTEPEYTHRKRGCRRIHQEDEEDIEYPGWKEDQDREDYHDRKEKE